MGITITNTEILCMKNEFRQLLIWVLAIPADLWLKKFLMKNPESIRISSPVYEFIEPFRNSDLYLISVPLSFPTLHLVLKKLSNCQVYIFP
jgi:hypothetical protein